MTEQTTSNATSNAPAESKAKVKTIVDDMTGRSVFESLDSAAEYLGRLQTFADFGSYPLIVQGMDAEGNIDPTPYEGMDVLVTKLNRQGDVIEVDGKKQRGPSTVKAVIVWPIPRVATLLETDTGRDWVNRILHKEINHVLVRPLRDAENLEAARTEMPTTAEAYISSGGTGGASTLEAYNTYYKDIIDLFNKNSPAFRKARLNKAELRKAFESTAYAAKWYDAIENRTDGSLFEKGLTILIALAEKKGFDASLLKKWLETRDATQIVESDADDESEAEFNVDDALSGLLDADAA